MTEVTTEAPKGLDAILSSAIDEHYVADAPSIVPDEEPPAKAGEQTTNTGPTRDEKGRFASAEAKPSEPGTAEAPAATPEVAALEAPRNFTAEQKAQFAKLQREAQEFLVNTEKAREAEYTRRSQEAAELKRTAEPFMQAVAPYHQYLAQIAPQTGQSPAQMVNAILGAEYALRTGNPQQKAQAFAQLAQQYGVNLAALNGGQPVAYQQQHQPVPQYNPAIQQLEQRLAVFEQERQANFEQGISRQIEDFKNAKDEKGASKYPYFEQVRSTMALSLANEEVQTLEEAYAKAVEPLKAILDKELASRPSAVENAQQAALEKAKKAAPVKSSTGANPKGGTQLKGLDAHLNAAIEKAGWV